MMDKTMIARLSVCQSRRQLCSFVNSGCVLSELVFLDKIGFCNKQIEMQQKLHNILASCQHRCTNYCVVLVLAYFRPLPLLRLLPHPDNVTLNQSKIHRRFRGLTKYQFSSHDYSSSETLRACING
jgi:hypothetical protein